MKPLIASDGGNGGSGRGPVGLPTSARKSENREFHRGRNHGRATPEPRAPSVGGRKSRDDGKGKLGLSTAEWGPRAGTLKGSRSTEGLVGEGLVNGTTARAGTAPWERYETHASEISSEGRWPVSHFRISNGFETLPREGRRMPFRPARGTTTREPSCALRNFPPAVPGTACRSGVFRGFLYGRKLLGCSPKRGRDEGPPRRLRRGTG